MKIIETIDFRKIWEVFDFHYLHPETLNEKEAEFVELKNHAYEDDWTLPKTITGWIYVEAWFDNMIEGQKGNYGATRLQWRPDMGLPIEIDVYGNSNNGASMWFIPQVYVGGEYRYDIKIDIQYTPMGAAEYGKLYATEKEN